MYRTFINQQTFHSNYIMEYEAWQLFFSNALSKVKIKFC